MPAPRRLAPRSRGSWRTLTTAAANTPLAIPKGRSGISAPTIPGPPTEAGSSPGGPQVPPGVGRYSWRMGALIDQEALLERVAGDPEFLATMVDIFVADAPT